MKIITLVENSCGNENCIAEHGLSIYIETEKHKLLLDTGQTNAIVKNAEVLGIDPSAVDMTSFFAEHRQEIADNGFSRRVLRHLPDRSRHLAQIWTAFCFTLALVLFVSLDGVQLILDTLRETFDTAIRSGASELDPKSLIIAGVVLLYFGYRKISSMA